jgi:hypothetical protein
MSIFPAPKQAKGVTAECRHAPVPQDCEPWITSPNSSQDLPFHFSNCIAVMG